MPYSSRALSKGNRGSKSRKSFRKSKSSRKSSRRKSSERSTFSKPVAIKVEQLLQVVKKETADPDVIVLEVPKKVSVAYGDVIGIDTHDRTSPLGREGEVKPHQRRNGSRGLTVEAKRQLAKERRKALKEGKKIEVDPELLPPVPCSEEEKTVVGYYRYDANGNRYPVRGYCRSTCPSPKPFKYVVKQEEEEIPLLEQVEEDIFDIRSEQLAMKQKIRRKLEEQERELEELERFRRQFLSQR